MSQDVFQHKMDQILERCPGTIGIADDIAVYGKTEQEHDRHLHNLMQVAAKNGLVFNSQKCAVKTPQITFFGMVYDQHGVQPDPSKVEAIKCMAPPQTKTELQEFIGMVTYLSPFIPRLSDHTADLRALLKKDAEFVWTASHQQAYNKVKDLVCEETTLAFFDANKETVIQVDASSRGLGAVLIQDSKPVAFASKSLSGTEQRYANIERELLAIVFGCERFHTYVYGKPFKVETDHKPLEMIHQKALIAAPPRLQRMLLRLQPYDITITYRPGKDMLLADTLSRRPSPTNTHINLDLQIQFVQFSKERIHQLRLETANDDTMPKLIELIVGGWPDKLKDLPKQLRPYWSFRDELSVENGVVLKGERVCIPASMQPYVLAKLHESHQGIEKTKLRAKDCVYWIDINRHIEELVRHCPTCQEHQRKQPKETLIPHEIPTRPWQVLGTDLFSFHGNNYLIVADFYSKFPSFASCPRRAPVRLSPQTDARRA